jgi:hypothetical protein
MEQIEITPDTFIKDNRFQLKHSIFMPMDPTACLDCGKIGGFFYQPKEATNKCKWWCRTCVDNHPLYTTYRCWPFKKLRIRSLK